MQEATDSPATFLRKSSTTSVARASRSNAARQAPECCRSRAETSAEGEADANDTMVGRF